ncbi:MAG: endonuclease/exonuclease/phosphatase family protein [Myxococcota bacterium]
MARIISWNVNGLRACAKKGFATWLARSRAQIVGIQEVRAPEDKIPEELRSPPRWHTHFVAAERAGYSGVGLFSRRKPDALETSLGEERFDREGRLQSARCVTIASRSRSRRACAGATSRASTSTPT